MRWLRNHRDAITLIVIIFGLYGANYAKNEHTAHVQQQQSRSVDRALCSDLDTMAAIPPPAGSAAANPSRAYEQAEHRAWSGLVRIAGCKP